MSIQLPNPEDGGGTTSEPLRFTIEFIKAYRTEDCRYLKVEYKITTNKELDSDYKIQFGMNYNIENESWTPNYSAGSYDYTVMETGAASGTRSFTSSLSSKLPLKDFYLNITYLKIYCKNSYGQWVENSVARTIVNAEHKLHIPPCMAKPTVSFKILDTEWNNGNVVFHIKATKEVHAPFPFKVKYGITDGVNKVFDVFEFNDVHYGEAILRSITMKYSADNKPNTNIIEFVSISPAEGINNDIWYKKDIGGNYYSTEWFPNTPTEYMTGPFYHLPYLYKYADNNITIVDKKLYRQLEGLSQEEKLKYKNQYRLECSI